MTDLRYFIVDAFTDRPFAGNPAAVFPLARWLPDATMRSIAAEMALSETAFFAPEDDGLRLRWFTPEVEVDLCGHATLASACVLMTQLEPARTAAAFLSRSGALGVARDGARFTLDFPARPPEPEPDPNLRDAVAAALGRRPRELWRSRDLVAVFDHAEDVIRLAPDFTALRAIDVHAVIATAPAGHDPTVPDAAFVSRFFAPREGIDEDPVTGSAHCTLVPMWAARLGRDELVGHQVSRRGGVVRGRLAGDRVRLTGDAVLVATGVLHLPA
jgi:PhzF family phenazine biosynthesis protein